MKRNDFDRRSYGIKDTQHEYGKFVKPWTLDISIVF